MPYTIVREGLRGGKSEGGAEEEMAKCTSLWLWWLMRRGRSDDKDRGGYGKAGESDRQEATEE